MLQSLNDAETRHAKFMAYQLGFASTWFRIEAEIQWEIADGEMPLPAHLQRLCTQITNTAEELVRLLASSKERAIRADRQRLQALIEEVWRQLTMEWNQPSHQEAIWLRNAFDTEYFNSEWMLEDVAVFGPEGLCRLTSVARTFWTRLPIEIACWAEVGQSIASMFDSHEPEEQAASRSRLEANLSGLQNHVVVQQLGLTFGHEGVRLPCSETQWPSFEAWVQSQAAFLHNALLARLGEFAPTPPGPSSEPAAAGTGAADGLPLSKDVLAMALLVNNPELTAQEIAQLVGCHRATLYRGKNFQAAIKAMPENKSTIPRGKRTRGRGGESVLEAIDDREPWQGLD
jgi:hypothetical protein